MNVQKLNRFTLLLILILSLGYFGSIVAGNTNSISQTATGFVSAKVISNIDLTDGQTEQFWSNITVYEEISEFGPEGYVKFANNGTHLFALFVTTVDNVWISIEFEPEPEECMTNLNDGWVIYMLHNTNETLAKDIKFMGTVRPDDDVQKDISVESIFADSYVSIEVMRPFNTNDVEGNDITFNNGSLNMIQFASDKNHIGVRQDYYLFISDQVVAGAEVTVTPEEIIIPTNIPTNNFNVNQLKFILLGLTPISVFAFMIVHTARRVYSSPIENENVRAVDKSFKAPTFMERLRETFLEKN
jgi:hypothetical protein